jgi:hypothetical protein
LIVRPVFVADRNRVPDDEPVALPSDKTRPAASRGTFKGNRRCVHCSNWFCYVPLFAASRVVLMHPRKMSRPSAMLLWESALGSRRSGRLCSESLWYAAFSRQAMNIDIPGSLQPRSGPRSPTMGEISDQPNSSLRLRPTANPLQTGTRQGIALPLPGVSAANRKPVRDCRIF